VRWDAAGHCPQVAAVNCEITAAPGRRQVRQRYFRNLMNGRQLRLEENVPTVMSSGPAQAGHFSVARRLLGGRLRALREKKGISREDAGLYIKASRSKISWIESGEVSIKDADLERLLDLYGITTVAARLAYIRLTSQLTERPWWYPHKDVLPGWLCAYLVLESVADQIRTYENRFVPGLLQTRAYAEAVIRQEPANEPDIQRRIDVAGETGAAATLLDAIRSGSRENRTSDEVLPI
jgi:transcriptional regulator with XRE-family HTH domain